MVDGQSEAEQGALFTPALGRAGLTRFYDRALRVFTREQRWRLIVTEIVAAARPQTLLDVGCGTGTLLAQLAHELPRSSLTGLDPDENVLALAQEKARAAGTPIEWGRGFARDAAIEGRDGRFDVVTCTLVFHQVPMAEKQAGLAAIHAALRPGGMLVLADYSLQRSWVMRLLFRRTVQWLDGRRDTQPNADGILPVLLAATGFDAVERAIVPTPSGSISIFAAERREG